MSIFLATVKLIGYFFLATSLTLPHDEDDLKRLQTEFESSAAACTHVATRDFVANRTFDLPYAHREEFAHLQEQNAKLIKDLVRWSRQATLARELVKHKDPKVRALALLTLFASEDPSHLPYIASLADDDSLTLKRLHLPASSGGYKGEIAEIESDQTVGEIASSILKLYYEAAELYPEFDPDVNFESYWAERSNRKSFASSYSFRIQRALSYSTHADDLDHKQKVASILKEVDQLPDAERALTMVYLHCSSFPDLESYLPYDVCVAALQKAGSEKVLKFLKRERVSDDPDLLFDDVESERIRAYAYMAHFILRRAERVLKPEDADALLALEKAHADIAGYRMGKVPWWAAAAAQLKSTTNQQEAVKILNAALERYPMTEYGGYKQAPLIAMLWRIDPDNSREQVVDWFFEAQANITEHKVGHPCHGLYIAFEELGRQDLDNVSSLVESLLRDKRAESLDWETMISLVRAMNSELKDPVLSKKEIYASYSNATDELKAGWRKRLLDYFDKSK